jgi:hypothetical protein
MMPVERSRLTEQLFQDDVRRLAEELLPGVRVEFLPAREQPHTDPVYPVRFKTDSADIVVAFPESMVLVQDGQAAVREAVTCLARLVHYFRR